MDAARLQTVINKGYRIAAQNIGLPFTVYRPASAVSVLAPGNIVSTLPASFASYAAQFSYDRAADHRDYYNNGLFDADLVQVRDYLVGDEGTWFVASKEPIKPPLCVRCNTVVSVSRPGKGGSCSDVGLSAYSGNVLGSDTLLMQGWPAAVRDAPGARSGYANLPMNLGAEGIDVVMPAFPGVEIRNGDVITDTLNRRCNIKSAELTHLGWKIVAVEGAA